MANKKKTANDVEVLTLGGDLTIAQATGLKQLLHGAVDHYQQVEIRFEDVTAVDLSCLQLLCSAHRTASALDKRLTLEGARPAVFRQAMQKAGLMRQKGCVLSPNTTCLWCGGDQ